MVPSSDLPITEYSVEDSRMLPMKSTASCALPTIALSKSLVLRRSCLKRSSLETSLEMSRKPIALPEASRRGVITTRALMRFLSLRMREITPSQRPWLSASSIMCFGRPSAMSSGACRISELALSTTSPAS